MIISKAHEITGAISNQIRDLPVSPATKKLLYLTYIRPILTFSTPAWGALNQTQINKLLTFER